MVTLDSKLEEEIKRYTISPNLPDDEIVNRLTNFKTEWLIHVKTSSNSRHIYDLGPTFIRERDKFTDTPPYDYSRENQIIRSTIATARNGKNIYYFNGRYVDEVDLVSIIDNTLKDTTLGDASQITISFLNSIKSQIRAHRHLSYMQLEKLSSALTPEERYRKRVRKDVPIKPEDRKSLLEDITKLTEEAKKSISAYCNEMGITNHYDFILRQMLMKLNSRVEIPRRKKASGGYYYSKKRISLPHLREYSQLLVEKFKEMAELVRENIQREHKPIFRQADYKEISHELLNKSYINGLVERRDGRYFHPDYGLANEERTPKVFRGGKVSPR